VARRRIGEVTAIAATSQLGQQLPVAHHLG
jgi:hypothetical protein